MPIIGQTRQATTLQKQHDEQCGCPACQGLECMERPRYFAGQLLTETELNTEQSYMRAKQRLHNRYLHGWGVVCGLQVVCNECDGWVTIKDGYAIDPCGNDVIVCADSDFNVIDYIHQCRNERKRRTDCTPVRTPPKQTCDDEETWCIYLSYVEQEARPVASLRSTKTRGCSCGGSCSGSCNCGCKSCQNKNSASSKSMKVNVSSTQTPLACEPTRIYETYRVDMEMQCDECGIDWRSLLGNVGTREVSSSPLLQMISGLIQNTNFDDTLMAKMLGCVRSVTDFVTKRIPTERVAHLYPAMIVSEQDVADGAQVNFPEVQVNDQYTASRQLYRAIRDLYVQNPLGVRCELASRLNEVDLPAPMRDEATWIYAKRIQPGVYDMTALLVQYLLDCLCQNLLPSCPPTSYDDRVPLACIKVKGDTIVSICNFSCRHYAGAFPTMFYWLSAVPIIPILGTLARTLCCVPDLFRGSQPDVTNVNVRAEVPRTRVAEDLARQTPVNPAPGSSSDNPPSSGLFGSDLQQMFADLDPTFTIRRSLLEGNLALPKMLSENFGRSIGAAFGGDLLRGLSPNAVNVSTLVGQTPDEVYSVLKQANVRVIDHEISGDIPREAAASAPFLNQGDSVVVYHRNDRVVGFARYDVNEQLASKETELSSIREEMAAMRAEIDALKSVRTDTETRPSGGRSSGRKKNG